MKKISFVCIFPLVLLLLLAPMSALADMQMEMKPTSKDFSKAKLRQMATDFFSVKCGMEKEVFKKAQMRFTLLCDTEWVIENGKKVHKPVGEAFWQIHVQSFPGHQGHEGAHILQLTREGKLISWSAHGPEQFEAQPDLMATGKAAVPLPTDAQESEIIQQAKADLKTMYSVNDPERFVYQAAFLYHENFNNGQLPIWSVYVYDGASLIWKGLYGYNGCYISIVPKEQDYHRYTTPHENFFDEVFGEQWYTEYKKLCAIQDNAASEADIKAWLSIWAPLYKEWVKEHPYPYSAMEAIEALLEKYGDTMEH